MAVACAVVVAVAAAGWFQLREDAPVAVTAPEVPDAVETVEQLTAASRQLEEVLLAPGLQTPVLTAAEAAAIVQIEDRLSLVDEAIFRLEDMDLSSTSAAPEAVVLWSHRVELLDALVEARGGRGNRSDIVYANTEWR